MTIAESFGLVFTSIGLTISALTLVVSMILVINKKNNRPMWRGMTVIF
ncbi:hypothetical protein B481_3336 [Planococcus halocryophilus Or1]|nr:hypothetical protein [Planococcus halocryophilus]EMF45459.1 hypothetical protein B481_3336 [Planococcus halocryophilus Or1]